MKLGLLLQICPAFFFIEIGQVPSYGYMFPIQNDLPHHIFYFLFQGLCNYLFIYHLWFDSVLNVNTDVVCLLCFFSFVLFCSIEIWTNVYSLQVATI